MKDDNKILKDLIDDTSSSSKKTETHNEVPNSPYSGIKRVLTEEDLNNIAIKKLILSENDRLERRVLELEITEKKFHIVDKEKAVLEEKTTKNNSFEILYSSSLSIGSVLAGISGIFWDKQGYLLLILGLVLMAGGIFAKIFRK